jgi:hypothetical protein
LGFTGTLDLILPELEGLEITDAVDQVRVEIQLLDPSAAEDADDDGGGGGEAVGARGSEEGFRGGD